jgi:hypothetical protein
MVEGRKESSFSEEKEAKRLLDALRGRRRPAGIATPAVSASRQQKKVFFASFFFRKKKSLFPPKEF